MSCEGPGPIKRNVSGGVPRICCCWVAYMARVGSDLVPSPRVDGNRQDTQVDTVGALYTDIFGHCLIFLKAKVCECAKSAMGWLPRLVGETPQVFCGCGINPLIDLRQSIGDVPMVCCEVLPLDCIHRNLPLQQEEALQVCAAKHKSRAWHIKPMDEAKVQLHGVHQQGLCAWEDRLHK